jgi:hypothetical protein
MALLKCECITDLRRFLPKVSLFFSTLKKAVIKSKTYLFFLLLVIFQNRFSFTLCHLKNICIVF